MKKHLDFEQPIVDLENKITELSHVSDRNVINLQTEIDRLKKRSKELTRSIFSGLSAWQIVQLARHPERPYTMDYIAHIVTDFEELHGDRHHADDSSMICGLGRIEEMPVVIIGQQKGRDTKEKIRRNFAMPKPEGYRKAYRIMQLAERFQLPIVTFIDTPGAYPGIDAEMHGQSNAIAENLLLMTGLRTPIVVTVIGEGGSGGALAIGIGDVVLMLEYAIYSVISPEGCASILWKTAEKASDAAEALGVTAERIHQLGVVDEVIPEPLGGAHRNHDEMATTLKKKLVHTLRNLTGKPMDSLLQSRLNRSLRVGFFERK